MKIAFYKATRPFPRGIFNVGVRWWTGGPYSHVEAVVAEDKDGYCMCASSSIEDGGVRIKRMKLDPEHWDIVEIDAPRYEVQQWFIDHKGEGYDFLGLFGFVGPRGIENKKRWFCSEAIAASLGLTDPWSYDPNTLHRYLVNRRFL
jgi:hypothetical protein